MVPIIICLICLICLILIIRFRRRRKISDDSPPSNAVQRQAAPRYKPKSWKEQYDEWLQDERWQMKRERILERDHHQCQWCRKETDLRVHHKAYHKFSDGSQVPPWDYPDRLLITLCKDCHQKWHKKYKVNSFYRSKFEHYS